MSFRFVTAAAAAALACSVATQASALTFNLGGSDVTLAAGDSLDLTVDGVTLSAHGYSFSTTPNTFQAFANGANASTVLATLTDQRLRREATGIGVCPPGEAGNQCNQVDTDGTNEILRLVLPTGYSLAEATFDRVDNNDTIKLYGVTMAGVVEYLGFGGRFDGAGTGTAFTGISGTQIGGSGEDQVYRVTFETDRYQEFWFTNNNDAADGYRVGSIDVAAVPEPGTWALLIGGFGLAGTALRRRRAVEASIA